MENNNYFYKQKTRENGFLSVLAMYEKKKAQKSRFCSFYFCIVLCFLATRSSKFGLKKFLVQFPIERFLVQFYRV
jgi:hypothetical protein